MRIRNLAVILGLAAAVGCSKTPVVEAPAPTEDYAARARADSIAAAEAARRAAMARADSIARAEQARAEQLAREEAARLDRMRLALRDTLTQRTHFDFDKSDIRPQERPALARKLAILKANTGLTIRIAGHADERGSDEYNLALGARRAASARAYLVNMGIAPARIEVVSYGEERPLVVGHDESAWSMNRRAEYIPVAGFEALIRPMASR